MTDIEKLIDLTQISLNENIGKSCQLAENIADYLLANGVVVMPCKYGDTLYDIGEFIADYDSPEIYEIKANFITVWEYDGRVRFTIDGMDYMYEDFGKTVFLTKEEAEKALAERSKQE